MPLDPDALARLWQRPVDRREFLRLGLLLGGASLAAGCGLIGLGGEGQPSAAPAARSEGGADQPVRIGYLPITDASALLVAHALGYYREEGLTAEPPVLFRGWSQIVEAFQARQVNVVHLLMPMAVWLRYSRRFPARVVAWNHVNGSALTVRPGVRSLGDLAGQTIAVPYWYSIHNVALQLLLRKEGIEPLLGGTAEPGSHQVRLVVMPPPDMVPALANGRIGGFIVADPFNALAELRGQGEILRFTGDIWKDHACCVVVMHEDDLQRRPQWTQAVVRAIVRAQAWLRDHRAEAARLLSRDGEQYLPQPEEVIRRVLLPDYDAYVQRGAIRHTHWHQHWIDFQPYPYPSFTRALVEHLKETRVEGDTSFLNALTPAQAAQDLVDDGPVRRAIEAVGGPGVFGQPADWRREEVIDA